MADLIASSGVPTVIFRDTTIPPFTDLWRWQATSATVINLERAFGAGPSWLTEFEFSSSGLEIQVSNPRLELTHSSLNAYALESNGSRLAIEEAGTDLVLINATEVKSVPNVNIQNANPTLTFTDTTVGAAVFTVDANGSSLFIQSNGTTVAESNGGYFFGNAGLGAGGNTADHVLRWKRFTGVLGAAGPATKSVVVTLGGVSRKLFGALVAVTNSTSEQGDTTWGVYDYVAPASGSSSGFIVTIDRFAANDRVNIIYEGNYGASALYKIIAFYEP